MSDAEIPMNANRNSSDSDQLGKSKPFLGGVIALYFVIGLEVLIMISPAAGFFYAAFNPFLLFLNQYMATRWLTAFFRVFPVSMRECAG
jgi:hypothetical protein